MAAQTRDEDPDRLLRELQAVTGESRTEAVAKSISERLERERHRHGSRQADPDATLREVWQRLKLVPNRDPRPDDEILGYGADGLPQ